MSSFLSQIHYKLYERIRYSDHIANTLSILLKNQKQISLLENSVLSDGALEDVIDVEQIHDWLSNRIQEVEKRLSSLLTTCIQEGLQQECEHLFYELGLERSNDSITTPKQALQYMQQYMLDGMPCEHGIQMIHDDEDCIQFIIACDVHMHINQLNTFMYMRFIWMKALLSKSNISISHKHMNFETRKEDTK